MEAAVLHHEAATVKAIGSCGRLESSSSPLKLYMCFGGRETLGHVLHTIACEDGNGWEIRLWNLGISSSFVCFYFVFILFVSRIERNIEAFFVFVCLFRELREILSLFLLFSFVSGNVGEIQS